jgi:peptidyl-prolyl cis-trans isomerase D
MMQMIRSSAGKVMSVIIVGGFLVWMVFGIGMEVTGAAGPRDLGKVNGTAISLEQYRQAVEALTQQARQSTGGRLTAEQQQQIEERAWQELVDDALLRQEMARRGIGVSNDEIAFAAQNIPHPELMQQEIFLTDGRFDLGKYQQFLRGPQASDQVLLQLEQYYRDQIPRSKLFRQVAAGLHVSDTELWRAYQDQNETATVEYVSLDLSKVAPTNPQVSEAEIRRYYDTHPEQFERPRTARFTVALLSTGLTPADDEGTLARVAALRREIEGGADFAEAARRSSQDPSSKDQGGDLGWIRRGQTVAAFDSATFGLPVGQLSQPVRTQFGFHLIQVQERPEGADSAKVRHILLEITKSDDELARIDARADSLEQLAEGGDLERAARAVGATVRQGVTVTETLPVIPGVGSALDALNWAAGEASDKEGPARPVSEVFDGEQALYVVRLEGYSPKGRQSLAEATPQIRQQVILEKKRETAKEVGRQILAAVRGGKTLQQAAQEKGLTVETAGPFTRVDPNTAFGQANAAIGAAFGTPVGQISQPVESTAGVFLVRPTARTQADRRAFDTQKEQMRQTATFRLQQSLYERWMESLRKKAEIQDNRDRVFGRAS